ncbi:hypothetical protein BsWGS_11331 [Bradybaena similaris]
MSTQIFILKNHETTDGKDNAKQNAEINICTNRHQGNTSLNGETQAGLYWRNGRKRKQFDIGICDKINENGKLHQSTDLLVTYKSLCNSCHIKIFCAEVLATTLWLSRSVHHYNSLF